jgi:quercetin dioxygenase-like cupin family protein
MKKFEKNNFVESDKHGIIGSFIEASSIRNDSNVEISFSKLEPGFTAAPHIHTQTKTVVIILKGGMTFSIDSEIVKVTQGEYIIFEKGCVEEVISVEPNTQNLTIHAPSILGGDKKEL